MRKIHCELVPPTASGRLYPKYDLEAEILSFNSEQEKEWPLGVDIDGNVIFDLDENFRVGMIDLLIGRARWKKQSLKWPAVLMDHDLVLKEESVVEKSFSLPVSVCFDPHAKIVRVDFPSLEIGEHISLSDFAIASLSSSGELASLWARDVF